MTHTLQGARVLLACAGAEGQAVAVLLRAEGATVELTAPDGDVVCRARDGEPAFDLVLLDLRQPGNDGHGTARRLREEPQLHALPIIALAEQADPRGAVGGGVDAVLGAPLDPRALARALEQHRGRAAPPPAAEPPYPAGLDAQATLLRIGGSRSLYEKLLRTFVARLERADRRISEALDVDDREAAIRHAHTLHGASATVGAEEVRRLASLLENELRDGTPDPVCRAHLVGLGVTLEALIRDLRVWLGQ